MKTRDSSGKWLKGAPSPNPAGRPKRSTVDCPLSKHASELLSKAVELALAGNTHALQMCLNRIAPPPANQRSINP